jgi:flagellar biosynthesis protein FlhB
MSDGAEKPFEATPQRIERAKREGNVARSSELGGNVAFAAAALAIADLAPALGASVRNAVETAAKGELPSGACLTLLALGTAPLLCACAAGAIVSILQAGGIHVTAVAFKFERLNPVEGLKRLFSRETAAHGVRAAAAFVLAVVAMWATVVSAAVSMTASTTYGRVAETAWHAARSVVFAACAVGAIFAVGEYAIARRAWVRKLRMTFEDRRREGKEQEGDPLLRGRRRSLHRSLLRGSLADVKKASFVVTNPTHVAVALEYRPPEVAVPRVLVRASGDAALRARALASAYGIPVVENVGLARALYRASRAGQTIDPVHYVAVAEVVSALIRAKELAT